MGDAYAAREEHDGAVGMENLGAAVGSFDESGEGYEAAGGEGFSVEAVGETAVASDYKGDGGLREGEGINCLRGAVCIAFFGVEVVGVLGVGFGPGDGEGMGGPETD